MTFDTLAVKPGRLPATIVELDLDSCQRQYGITPCVATLALTNLLLQSSNPENSPWVHPTIAPMNVGPAKDGPPPNFAANGRPMIPDDFATDEVHIVHQVLTAGDINTTEVFTFSIYAATGVGILTFPGADSGNLIRLRISTNGVAGAFVDVDLRNGMLFGSGDESTGAPFVSFKLETQPNLIINSTSQGWVRISLTFTFDSTTDARAEIIMLKDDGALSFVGEAGVGIYFTHTQVRPGNFAGFYTDTLASTVDGGGAVDDLCFNSFGTCQDTANYLKQVKTYRFIDATNTPIDISDAFPAILEKGVKYTPTKLQPGGGFSIRGKVTVRLQDFTHDDIAGPIVNANPIVDNSVDNYALYRTYDPANQGTFFAKLKARNEFYVGRPMRVLEGYMDEPFSLTNFRTREYIIDEIRGPSATGLVEIIGKDVLSLTIDNRAKCPTPSDGTLNGAHTAATTTINVSAGDGPDYDVDKHIRINDEIISISSRSVDALTVVRGQGGTTAKAHTSGDAVQSCFTQEDIPVIDTINTLLVTFASVPASFIPFTDWELEETESLAGYNMETIISEPTGVTALLKEIMEITLIDLWYSDVDQQIKLKLETPFTAAISTIDENDEILLNSLKVKDVQTKRISRVLIWYGMRNFAESLSEPANFGLANFEIEVDKEAVNKFNDERIKVIFSRWFDSTNLVQVQLTSQRLLQRFGLVPKELTFDIDAKDVTSIDTGDVVDIISRVVQTTLGLPKIERYQIIETQPRFPGSIYRYKALAYFLDPVSQGPTVVSTNQTDLNLFVLLGGPSGPIETTVTINSGVLIDSTQGNPSLTTGDLHPDSTITLINNGDIKGHGGPAGAGGAISIGANAVYLGPFIGWIFLPTFDGMNGPSGKVGGNAIDNFLNTLIIDNTNGNVWGGAGGGGGGAPDYNVGGGGFNNAVDGGGGGGGGIGSDGVGTGGVGGVVTLSAQFPGMTKIDGSAGNDGTISAHGTGGLGGTSTPAGAGGRGGNDFGRAGVAGGPSTGLGSWIGGGGGPSGKAVNLNGGSVDWLGGNNPAQRKGAVN